MDYKNWTNWTSKENTTLPLHGLGGGSFWWYQNTDLYYYAYKTWYYSFIVTFSIGIPVNALIFITLLSSEKLRRNSSGILIIYLAMWEFVDSVIRISDWFLSYMPCAVFDYVLYVPQFIANTSMFLISLNRYALVCHPFSHQKITGNKQTISQITLITAIALVAHCYALVTPKIYDEKANTCKIDMAYAYMNYVATMVISVSLGSFVPIFGVFIFTMMTIIRLKKRGGLKDAVTNQGSSHHQKAEKNTTKSLIWICSIYIFLTLPYLIMYMIYSNIWASGAVQSIFNTLQWLHIESFYYIGAMITGFNRINNFFVFLACHRGFRGRLIELIMCGRNVPGTGSGGTGKASAESSKQKNVQI